MTDTASPALTPTSLFLVTLLPLVQVGLRRYQGLAGGWRCGPNKRHEATTWLEAPLEQAIGDHRRTFEPGPVTVALDDPRWPTTCGNDPCAGAAPGDPPYAFATGDHAVVLHERLGRREDTCEQVLAYSPPVGGVVQLDYLAIGHYRGDGRCLGVGTPDGLWYLDVPGRAGEVWERIGSGAHLTVVQTAGPPWRWRISAGVLFEEEAARAG